MIYAVLISEENAQMIADFEDVSRSVIQGYVDRCSNLVIGPWYFVYENGIDGRTTLESDLNKLYEYDHEKIKSQIVEIKRK